MGHRGLHKKCLNLPSDKVEQKVLDRPEKWADTWLKQGRINVMQHLGQCSSCPTVYFIDLDQIARGLSSFACPTCGALSDFADRQQVDPNLSQGTKDMWAVIGTVSVVAGLFIFAKLADHVYEQLTA